ncbi:MAG: hypothetical protein JST00_27165 [Deltaproteobacteria bacterium]|nr:hypothetical protein [Deltaproteobacteria bacterium]
MIRARVVLSLLSALALPLAACAAPDEAEGSASQEAEARVRPTGIDARTARLVLEAPTGVKPAFFGVHGATGSKKTGEAFDVLVGSAPVRKNIWLEGTALGLKSDAGFDRDLAPGVVTTVKLAGLKVKRAGMARTLGLESRQGAASYTGVAVDADADGVEAVAVVANASHRLEWGLYDGQVFTTAAEGSISTLRMDAVGPRMRVKVVAPQRELPDACRDTNGPAGTIRIASSAGAVEGVIGAELIVGFNPLVARANGVAPTPNATYTLPCSGWSMPLTYSASGAAPRELRLGRIDVDDVDVTLPNGATEARRGTYRILAQSGAVFGDREFPTNTGVDVPPGTYDIDVTHLTNAGERSTKRYRVTTP